MKHVLKSRAVFYLSFFLVLLACQHEEEILPVTDTADQEEIPAGEIIPGQYIITFTDGEASARLSQPSFTSRAEKARFSEARVKQVTARVNKLMQEKDIPTDALGEIYAAAITGFSAKLTDEEVVNLRQEANVHIEPDHMVYLDNFNLESVADPAASTRGQTTGCGIKKIGGSAKSSQKEAWVWIVDTGIDLYHPDLNVVRDFAKSFVGGKGNDCNGHGTHVAGIIGAKNNNRGVVGVSAGAQVVPVKVFKCSGGSPVSKVLAGIDYVARYDLEGDVMNLSLSGFYGNNCYRSSAYRKAVMSVAKGGTWVAIAAGNDHDNASLYQPACLNGKKIFTVASMTCNGSWSDFSNYGAPIDWVATGSNVYSTYKGGGYATMSGTSMATPHIAGILHQRGKAPVQCGSITHKGKTYKVACRK